MKSSVFSQYVHNVLEQSPVPCDRDEVIEKVAYALDMPIDELKGSMKSYFLRSEEIVLVPYSEERGDKKIVLKSKFDPISSQEDAVRNVLNYFRKPIEEIIFWGVLDQLDIFKVDYHFRDFSFFPKPQNIIAYFAKKNDIENIEGGYVGKGHLLIGLEEWGNKDGYWRVPNETADISVLKNYLDVNLYAFNKLKENIMQPYINALDVIPFKIRTYETELNNLVDSVFVISSFDDKNMQFYISYKECMAHIKQFRQYPTKKTNPDLFEWWKNNSNEGINPILYYMCIENIRNSEYFYSKTLKRKKR